MKKQVQTHLQEISKKSYELRENQFELEELRDTNAQMHEVIDELQDTLVNTIKTRDQFIDAVTEEHELVIKQKDEIQMAEQKEESILELVHQITMTKSGKNSVESSFESRQYKRSN